eukprot:5397443-Prymnesium_polylepis.1
MGWVRSHHTSVLLNGFTDYTFWTLEDVEMFETRCLLRDAFRFRRHRAVCREVQWRFDVKNPVPPSFSDGYGAPSFQKPGFW